MQHYNSEIDWKGHHKEEWWGRNCGEEVPSQALTLAIIWWKVSSSEENRMENNLSISFLLSVGSAFLKSP